MENACYYTFSTICQTLAGAFGVLLVVVFYRMQALRGEFWRIVVTLDRPEALRFNAAYTQALREGPLTSDFHHLFVIADLLTAMPEGADALGIANNLRRIRDGLPVSLRVTGLTIGGSLVALAATHGLACCPALAIALLVAGVVSSCFCLWTYYRLAGGILM